MRSSQRTLVTCTMLRLAVEEERGGENGRVDVEAHLKEKILFFVSYLSVK